MADAGIKVARTWGGTSFSGDCGRSDYWQPIQAFNAVNATELPTALETNLTYYQVWNGSDWTLNEGPQGLQRLDYVVQSATQHGIKLILTFTNNWYVVDDVLLIHHDSCEPEGLAMV